MNLEYRKIITINVLSPVIVFNTQVPAMQDHSFSCNAMRNVHGTLTEAVKLKSRDLLGQSPGPGKIG